MHGLHRFFILLSATSIAVAGCGGDDAEGSGATSSAAGTGGGATATAASTGATTSTAATSTGAGAAGSGGAGGGPVACEPADVSGFDPDWKPPSGLYQGVCTEAQIDELIDTCFLSGDQTACEEFAKANTTCLTCALTDISAPEQGPIALYPDHAVIDVNFGQCIAAVTGDDSASGCGATNAAWAECAFTACGDNCPVETQADLDALNACIEDALAGGCKTWSDAGDECLAELEQAGAPIEPCIWGNDEDFFVYAKRVALLFCGEEPTGTGGGGAGGAGGGGTGGAGGGGGAGGAGGGSGS